jgi:uncharacterized protein YkwD
VPPNWEPVQRDPEVGRLAMTGVVTRGRRATAVALVVGSLFVVGLHPQPADAAVTRHRDQMLVMTNRDRSQRHKPRLALDLKLSKYAKRHSRQMAHKGFLFHSSDLAAKLKGVRWRVGGENVGEGSTLSSLEKAFMHSREHRENILRKAFDHIAIGVFKTKGTFWVTVIFYG